MTQRKGNDENEKNWEKLCVGKSKKKLPQQHTILSGGITVTDLANDEEHKHQRPITAKSIV